MLINPGQFSLIKILCKLCSMKQKNKMHINTIYRLFNYSKHNIQYIRCKEFQKKAGVGVGTVTRSS